MPTSPELIILEIICRVQRITRKRWGSKVCCVVATMKVPPHGTGFFYPTVNSNYFTTKQQYFFIIKNKCFYEACTVSVFVTWMKTTLLLTEL